MAVAELAEGWDFKDSERALRIHQHMRRLMEGSPQIALAWILDAEGRSVLDSWQYPPVSLSGAGRGYFQAHKDGQPDPVLGRSETGAVSKRPRFTISRALRNSDGSLRGVVAAGIHTDYFSRLYEQTAPGAAGRAGLVLMDGTPLALWRGDAPEPEQSYHLEILKRVKASGLGTAVLQDRDGRRLVSWRRSERFPYYSVVSQDIGQVLADWRRRSMMTAAFVVLTLAGFAGLAMFGVRSARAERRAAMNEVLMREVHHRVKNNLQIVSSLIGIKGREAADGETRQTFEDLVTRVNAIARVHDLTHKATAFEKVGACSLLRSLCAELARSSDRRIDFDGDDEAFIAPDAAIPLTLASNELITNALKHASGMVEVSCARDDGDIVVQVRDDGEGLPHDFEFAKSQRFGMRLVQTLTAQLEGRFIVVPSAKGAAFEIRLPALADL